MCRLVYYKKIATDQMYEEKVERSVTGLQTLFNLMSVCACTWKYVNAVRMVKRRLCRGCYHVGEPMTLRQNGLTWIWIEDKREKYIP